MPLLLRLKPGREKSLRQRHPWIFSGAIAAADGELRSGDTVNVLAADGAFLAQRGVLPELADSRARLDVRSARTRRRRLLRAARRSRSRGASADARCAPHRVPARPRRIRRPARRGRRSLCGHRRAAAARRPAPSAGATRSSRRSSAATAAACVVRALGCRRAQARRPLAAHRRRAYGALAERVTLRRGRTRLSRRRRRAARRPGSISTSAPNRAAVRRLAAGREVLNVFCLHGRLHAGGARRRCDARASRSTARRERSRSRAKTSRCNRRAAGRPRAMVRGRRLRGTAKAARPGRRFRHGRARSAEVRADRGARRARGARVQGRQPARVEAAAPGRPARDVFVLGGHRRRVSSARSSPAPRRMRARTPRSSATFGAGADHPVALAFPEGDYLKGLLLRKAS